VRNDVKRCVESCREWYQAFSNMGKGNEPSVKELLTTADLIESLAAELEQVKQERDGLSIMLTAAESAAETYKREKDAYFESMKGLCATCKKARFCVLPPGQCPDGMWEWRGIKEGPNEARLQGCAHVHEGLSADRF